MVLYSREHKRLTMAYKLISLKNLQYWLEVELHKPKQAFRLTQNAFNELLWNFKQKLNFLLTE